MYGIDMSGWGGLASTAADTASSLAPAFDFSSVIAPTLDPAALTGVAGTLAEEGTNAATGLVPNLTAPVAGLAGSANKLGSWFSGNIPAENVGGIMNNGGTFDAAKNTITDASGSLYSLNGDGSLSGQGMFGQGMKFFNDNSKGLEAGGKLAGGLAGMYSAMQNSKLAKEQINMMKDNTAYNRSRQAAGDKSLQEASDRVFGVSTPYTDAALGAK